jgi:phosphorylated CTD-interacting factor 1
MQQQEQQQKGVSRKERERAKTTRRLHGKISKAETTGIAEKVAAKLPAKHGKANIWISAEVDKSILVGGGTGGAGIDDSVDFELALEVFRAEKISQHRQTLLQLCLEEKLPPPIYLWERWHCRCILAERERNPTITPETLRDDIMPCVDGWCDEGTVTDLVRASFPEENARNIATQLSSDSAKYVSDICSYAIQLKATPATSSKIPGVSVIQHKHTLDFICSSSRKKILKINNAHYARLKEQFIKVKTGLATEQQHGPPAVDIDEGLFHKRMYILLSQYHSLLGHGFQAALNEHSFRVLLEHFDVKFECFASPLNSTCSTFSSVFPLNDAHFGSVGNFFALKPTEGSFEANPPFIPELMLAMFTHISSLLTASTGPMSYVVIVPGWEDDPAWIALSKSKFLRRRWIVAATDHGYCDGAQHQRQDRYRESPYDTGVFILQNDQGARRWPSGPEVEAALRVAMAHAVPTAMMKLRRLRDGRGNADLDGGGGVYKGMYVCMYVCLFVIANELLVLYWYWYCML